jgi:hypothetical protein
MSLNLSDLFFWRGAVNTTGLVNITGVELAALIAAQIPSGAGNIGKGALISCGVQSIADSSLEIIDWSINGPTITYDDFGMFDPAEPTKLSIPAGEDISRVWTYCLVQWQNVAIIPADKRTQTVDRNGATAFQGGIFDVTPASTGGIPQTSHGAPVIVTPGVSWFQLQVAQSSGAPLSISRADFAVIVAQE